MFRSKWKLKHIAVFNNVIPKDEAAAVLKDFHSTLRRISAMSKKSKEMIVNRRKGRDHDASIINRTGGWGCVCFPHSAVLLLLRTQEGSGKQLLPPISTIAKILHFLPMTHRLLALYLPQHLKGHMQAIMHLLTNSCGCGSGVNAGCRVIRMKVVRSLARTGCVSKCSQARCLTSNYHWWNSHQCMTVCEWHRCSVQWSHKKLL